MPLRTRCKSCDLKKVENRFRTATAEKFLLCGLKNHHAYAICTCSSAASARSNVARRQSTGRKRHSSFQRYASDTLTLACHRRAHLPGAARRASSARQPIARRSARERAPRWLRARHSLHSCCDRLAAFGWKRILRAIERTMVPDDQCTRSVRQYARSVLLPNGHRQSRPGSAGIAADQPPPAHTPAMIVGVRGACGTG